jgi:hypothetical protein
MNLTAIYYVLMVFGITLVLTPPIIPLARNHLLNAKEYTFQVYIPVNIGLLFLILAFYGILKDMTNERLWEVLIAFSASGSVFISLVAAFHSVILLRWRAD